MNQRNARHCTCRIEAVLVQNHSFNVWHDDLGSLAEEDVLAASDISATLSELQSFTDMSYSQGRCVAALQWVPARKVMPAPCSQVSDQSSDIAQKRVLLMSLCTSQHSYRHGTPNSPRHFTATRITEQ